MFGRKKRSVRICAGCGEIMPPDKNICVRCESPDLRTAFVEDALRLVRRDGEEHIRQQLSRIRRVAA
jgi:ribosomal protein L40E